MCEKQGLKFSGYHTTSYLLKFPKIRHKKGFVNKFYSSRGFFCYCYYVGDKEGKLSPQ